MAFLTGGQSYNPLQLGAIGLQSLGTSLGIFGALQKGSSDELNARIKYAADERTALARADADSFNAKVARQLALAEERKTAADAADYRRVGSSKIASARAARADSGLALEGSPLLVDASIFKEVEFGVDRIVNAGAVNATRMRNQATLLDVSSENNRRTADLARAAGDASVSNIRSASRLNAAALGLSGATGIARTLLGDDPDRWNISKRKASNTVSSWEDGWSSNDGTGYW